MIPSPASLRHTRFGLLYAVVAFVADQLSKLWLVDHLRLADYPQGIEVVPFFKLIMVWNYGISFGMFADAHDATRRWLLIAVAIAITLAMLVWLWRIRTGLLSLALGLVIGGAVGNIIDRLRWGAVADFFYFHYQEWYWPAFNIADSAIFIGVVLLCWESIVNPEKTT
jgi:signal peptidase II